MNGKRQSDRAALLAVVLVAFGLRLWHLLETRANDPFYFLPSVDPKVYHEWALRILGGDFIGDRIFFLSPLYPYFLAAVYAVFGVGFFAAKLAHVLLGTLNAALVFRIGQRVFGRAEGIVAGLISATYVMGIFYDVELFAVSLQTTLNCLAALLAVACFEKPERRLRWLPAGFCLGLSALARPNVLLFAGFVLAGILIGVAKARVPWKGRAAAALLFAAGTAAAVLPVTYRNWVVGRDFVLVSSQGGVNFYIGNGPDANGSFQVPTLFLRTRADDPLQQEQAYREKAEQATGRALRPSEVSDYWFSKAVEQMRDEPGRAIRLLARKAALFVNYYEIGSSREFYASRDFSAVTRLPLPDFGLIGPMGLLGMALAARLFRKAFVLYAMVFTYAISLTLFFVLDHYRMPITPFFILFAAHGLCWIAGAARRRKLVPILAAAAGLALAFALAHIEFKEAYGNQAMAHYNLGNKYRAMRKPDLAIREYERSLELGPDYISAYNNLALTYEETNNSAKAIDNWRSVLYIAERNGDGVYIERARRHLERLDAIRRRAGGRSAEEVR